MVVVVLGSRLRSEEIHGHLEGRVDVGIRMLRDGDESLVMTGGQTNPNVAKTESEAMKAYAVEQGVDPDRIIVERNARDTVGNGYFSARIVRDRLDTSTVRVATSCHHASRAVFVFENCFGEEYDVSAVTCYESGTSRSKLAEKSSIDRNRAFFESVRPGDLNAIRERMVETHDLYSREDFERA